VRVSVFVRLAVTHVPVLGCWSSGWVVAEDLRDGDFGRHENFGLWEIVSARDIIRLPDDRGYAV
jgi:hypothetical protein